MGDRERAFVEEGDDLRIQCHVDAISCPFISHGSSVFNRKPWGGERAEQDTSPQGTMAARKTDRSAARAKASSS